MVNTQSKLLFEKAKNYFPGGVNSPVRAFRSVGGSPLFIEKGKGSHIWDADGNEFIDYCCSWGPLILGHANDKIINAVDITMRKGTSFGAPTKLENQLAELILSFNKYIQKIRFVSSGTEAVMSAIRLARGYTKRDKILKFEGCYHGHVDSLLVKAGSGLVTFGNSSSAGVPNSFVNETIVVPLNNKEAVIQAFNKFKNEIACIIIEPLPANNGLLIQGKEFFFFSKKNKKGMILNFCVTLFIILLVKNLTDEYFILCFFSAFITSLFCIIMVFNEPPVVPPSLIVTRVAGMYFDFNFESLKMRIINSTSPAI